MLKILTSVCFLLWFSGCGSTFHLVYDKSYEVIDRATNQRCGVVYFNTTVTHLDEAYGAPCQIIIRRFPENVEQYGVDHKKEKAK
jgi:hypothetical protein